MLRPRTRRGTIAGLALLLLALLMPATALGAADLSITNTDDADPVTEGDAFTYVIDVANAGPDTAGGVQVIDRLHAKLDFVQAVVPSGGSCGLAGREVTCNLGAIDSGRSGRARIRVRPTVAGTFTNTARVSSNEPDPAHENNSATATTTVLAAPVCAGRKATIVGTEGNDSIPGTDKVDVIVALGGNDSIEGLRGNDVVCGGAGDDAVKGHGGNDTVRGGAGDDAVRGGGGNDNLRGGGGADDVQGGTADDLLEGVGGSDVLSGVGGATCSAGAAAKTRCAAAAERTPARAAAARTSSRAAENALGARAPSQ